MQSSSGAVFFAGVAETTLATLGNWEVEKDITPSDFSGVFNLPNTNIKPGF